MSLTTALGIAQSALSNTAAQSALLSTNIANVNNADYNRESAQTISQSNGTVTTGTTSRAADSALLTTLLSAQSSSSGQQALSDGLTQIANTLNLDSSSSASGTTDATDNSPATAIGALTTALQQFAASPDNTTLAATAVTAAQSLATNLNQASATVQQQREAADGEMATSVSTINDLLTQFQSVNATIVSGTKTGADVSNAEDTRDSILKQLSQQIGISTVQSTNGSTAIYTDSGATLFNVTARTVAFTPTSTYTASTVGNAVTVDGVPVTGSSAVMPITSGALAGYAQLRDVTAPDYQNQLDQIAGNLISTFSETQQTSNGATSVAGLFTSSGSTNLPTSTTGLAATISVASNAVTTPTTLRDGDIAGTSSNTSNAAAYATRLNSLVTALGQTQTFNSASGGSGSGTLASYAESSVGWLEAQRQTATTNATNSSALATAATTALSNSTGVNLDDQMSQMLEVEHAYQASAQLMNTVNSMYSSLLQAFN